MTNWEQNGKIVIVTGASSGIRGETARALHGAGAHPMLAARRVERIEELAAELDDALAVETDVTDPKAQARLVEATLERHGRIDGLVNNAGIKPERTARQVDADEFSRVLDLNVVSVVTMTQAVLPTMRAQGAGRIVNISSGSTRRAPVGLGAYAATKSALNMLSAVWRQELEPDGITVSLLLPSMTATEFGDATFKLGVEVRPGILPQTPQYVTAVILRTLCTGEERVDIQPGPEDPAMTEIPRGTRPRVSVSEGGSGPESGEAGPVAGEWRAAATERLYTSPWVSLDLVEVAPPGRPPYRHHVVRVPAAVGVVVKRSDGRVLLLRRHRFITGTTGFEIPAEAVDDGESIEDAARRETREETGVEVGELERFFSCSSSDGVSDQRFHFCGDT